MVRVVAVLVVVVGFALIVTAFDNSSVPLGVLGGSMFGGGIAAGLCWPYG